LQLSGSLCRSGCMTGSFTGPESSSTRRVHLAGDAKRAPSLKRIPIMREAGSNFAFCIYQPRQPFEPSFSALKLAYGLRATRICLKSLPPKRELLIPKRVRCRKIHRTLSLKSLIKFGVLPQISIPIRRGMAGADLYAFRFETCLSR